MPVKETAVPTWIRADADFSIPYVLFRIGLRNVVGDPVLQIITDSGPRMADEVGEVIARKRPDLAGGCVLGVEFRFDRQCWLVAYAHPSLPRPARGSACEEWPLEPAPDRPVTIQE